MGCYEIDGVTPVIEPGAFVHDTAVLIGDVVVETGCYIGPHASLRGDFGRITVRRGSNVQDSATLHAFPGEECLLEENSHIGHAAVLHGCRIESWVLVGIGATVLDGAVIGHDSLLGAGTLVTAGTQIPPESMVLGSPGKVVRRLDEKTIAWKRNGVRVYQDLTVRSLATLRPVDPLSAVPADRPRVSTGRETSVPLHTTK